MKFRAEGLGADGALCPAQKVAVWNLGRILEALYEEHEQSICRATARGGTPSWEETTKFEDDEWLMADLHDGGLHSEPCLDAGSTALLRIAEWE